MKVITTTAALALREVNLDDAAFIHELYCGEDFRRNIGDRGIATLDDAKWFINHKLRGSYREHGFGLWVVEVNGEPAGVCGLVKRDYLACPDIGFALLPRFYGQGIARQAALATLDYAVEHLQLQQVLAITSQANSASQRLLSSIGFQPTAAVTEPTTGEQLTTFMWSPSVPIA
ncbi:GNAT family N-acetyltransferase [Pseudidiomarina salilacus]|uniref:GNAT family N-acetyltransferase n=1 Tax=Pseudidiomarina salilacus TaxID=3384452 RepID=UPI003984EC5E